MAKGALHFAFAKCYNWEGSRNLYSATVEQSSCYDTVKELFLKAYELVPETYRQI